MNGPKRSPELIELQRAAARQRRRDRRVTQVDSVTAIAVRACHCRLVWSPDTVDVEARQSALDRIGHRGDVWYVGEDGKIRHSRYQ